MNWDDLRIIAAVRDEGTYAGASARLRIDETTVGRRLARIQRDLGVPLFEAADGLRRPTRHCEAVLDHVGAMAAHVAAIDRLRESQPGPVGPSRSPWPAGASPSAGKSSSATPPLPITTT